jgi:hypothetical protein
MKPGPAISALAKAWPKCAAWPITSPVERISGPSRASIPRNFLKGSTASLTKKPSTRGSSVRPSSSSVAPAMIRAARRASGTPVALET